MNQENKQHSTQDGILYFVDSLFFTIDKNDIIANINPAAEEALSISRSQLIGKSLMCVFEQAGKIKRLINRCQKDKQHIYIDNIAIFSLKKRLIVKAHIFVNHQENNSPVYIECQEINLKSLSANDENIDKMSLIKNIAHEVKNPLGGIRGAAQLLENQIQNREHRQFLRIIIKEADRLNEWLDKLSSHALDSSKIPLNIHKVLEHTYGLIKAELEKHQPHGIILKRDYDPSLPDVLANQSALIQVFLNLGRNAMQSLLSDNNASRKNTLIDEPYYQKKINFRTRIVYDVIVNDQYHRRAIKAEIIDNGRGINAKEMPSIFAPLVSYKEDGSGLGLSIAKDIIHDHGGDIIVNSTAYRSTVFSVILPIAVTDKKQDSSLD